MSKLMIIVLLVRNINKQISKCFAFIFISLAKQIGNLEVIERPVLSSRNISSTPGTFGETAWFVFPIIFFNRLMIYLFLFEQDMLTKN